MRKLKVYLYTSKLRKGITKEDTLDHYDIYAHKTTEIKNWFTGYNGDIYRFQSS